MSTYLLAAESNQSLNILITGFAVVFAVLLILIGIIKLYSTIVSGVQKKTDAKAAAKAAAKASSDSAAAPAKAQPVPVAPAPANGALDLQTVAVITAAAEAYYGDTKVRVTGISRASSARSEWATAGVHSNILNRSEGLF